MNLFPRDDALNCSLLYNPSFSLLTFVSGFVASRDEVLFRPEREESLAG